MTLPPQPHAHATGSSASTKGFRRGFSSVPHPRLAGAVLVGVPLAAMAVASAALWNTLFVTGGADLARRAAPLTWHASAPSAALGEIANAPQDELPHAAAFRRTFDSTPVLETSLWPTLAPMARSGDPIEEYMSEIARGPRDISYRVASSDTLLGILAKQGVGRSQAHAFVQAIKSSGYGSAAQVRPDQRLEFSLGRTEGPEKVRAVESARMRLSAEAELRIERSADGSFEVARVDVPLSERHLLARGEIVGSLAASAQAEDVSATIVAKFADIYAYHVDFQRDIHPNDKFEVFYTELFNEEGERVDGRGEIIFASLSFSGKTKEFYRFTNEDGQSDFYDETGKSARTFLMRTPVESARISSGFGKRKHPILGFMKDHNGVDFAAPSGTSVYAAGDGVVVKAGWGGTFGNVVKLRHENGYETVYAHLSSITKGLKPGRRVKQGQVIAKVGTTGRSTGPHLHYEVHVANRPVNPMGVKVATGRKLSGHELKKFRSEIERIETAMIEAQMPRVAELGQPGVVKASFTR